MEADCPNNTEYRACSGADMQPGRQPWVQQKSDSAVWGALQQDV